MARLAASASVVAVVGKHALAQRVVATSVLSSRADVTHVYGARANTAMAALDSLSSVGMAFGIDATTLHHHNEHLLRLLGGPPSTVLWNFPHVGVDENDHVHQALFASFFPSAAASFGHVDEWSVVIVLQADQFSRWAVEAAARAALLLLAHSEAVTPEHEPSRNAPADRFDYKRTTLYRFAFRGCHFR